jgi:predicted Rossmann fold flavoprotein
MDWDLIVVGGGAAGIFAAISAKEACQEAKVLVLEKSVSLLTKVRISGGGRCNVTHALFDPKLLVQNYPRGSKELLGPLYHFGPKDTVEWFEKRGVSLKIEKDGRIFPVSDKSASIIDALLGEADKLHVVIQTKKAVEAAVKEEEGFLITLKDGITYKSRSLLLATGSGSDGHRLAESFGHTIQPLVPSLFTFNVPTSPLKELSGISLPRVTVGIENSNLQESGPILITHFGFTGPVILRLSAFGAPLLAERAYKTAIWIQWVLSSEEEIFKELSKAKQEMRNKLFSSVMLFPMPKNLWKALLGSSGEKNMRDLSTKELREVAKKLFRDRYEVDGKTTHKEEFVTAGGVSLKEVDFKTMESKKVKGLFFAGEVLDIDGVTGGFNFQNAWTDGFIVGRRVGAIAHEAHHPG